MKYWIVLPWLLLTACQAGSTEPSVNASPTAADTVVAELPPPPTPQPSVSRSEPSSGEPVFPCSGARGLTVAQVGEIEEIRLDLNGRDTRLRVLINEAGMIGLGIVRPDSCYVEGAGNPVGGQADYRDLRWLHHYEKIPGGTVVESAVVEENGDISYDEVERWTLPADGIRFFPDETGGFAILYFSGDTLKWYAGE
ncbi:hypothetical protein [Lewinella sp. W8]|uniref:hypothetical protein n=1 Tax=Lewinella sp. W8 TaxID=2528208 RepID=UPI0010684796|nr:hypothetical protein [Lewinella sp. W8]MTB51937.1 hypothetical protein [Lewinella sp. W8]